MKPSTAIPLDKACQGSNLSDPPRGKSFLLTIFLSLALLLLVGCAGASIIAEPGPSRPPDVGAEAAKTGLVEPSPDLASEPSRQLVADSKAPAEALVHQADNLGDGRPVKPASLPSASSPSVENAGKELVPASPALTLAERPIGEIAPEGPQLGQRSKVAAEETPAEVSSQPAQEPLEVPAASTEDTSPSISLPLAPAFTLTSASGKPVSLETYRGKSNVVLVFYRGFW